MSDLTLIQLKNAYDAALEQIAAESFLAFGISPAVAISRLQAGNNPDAVSTTDDLPGKLRMTLEQAQAFTSRYTIIDVYQNDVTGFSAVALRDTANSGRVVLAVRSTEINNDRTRDVGADLQIFTSGFAFDQILSAQDFLDRVQPLLQTGEKIDLVGYSLSGNIVRTLAAMNPDVVNQNAGSNVVFNATGLGGFTDPTGQNRPRNVVLQEMMNLYRQVEADPNSVTDVPVPLVPLQLTAIAAAPIDRTDPNGNVYPSPRNDFAEAYIQNKYTTFYNDFGTTVAEPTFAQYFGVALSGFDASAVANSGSHPAPVGVGIEGQPVVEIPGVAPRLDYLNTHSLTLLADSLRLQILFKEIDPTLSTDTIQGIFQASSASAANTLLGRAEKDTLENALDALRKALLPADPNFQPTPSSDAAGSFGNIGNRTAFHNNITAVEAVLPTGPQPYQIETLVNRPLEEVKGNALLDDVSGKGLAYRYALTALNPFAIIGPTYSQHNPNGELALFNPGTGLGSITTDYVQDRGLFLETKLAVNQANLEGPLNPFALTHYHDNATRYDIPSGLSIPPGVQREYIFGSDVAETIAGGSLFSNDHLYGGDGVDTLLGNGGDDYLQGDDGNDTLDGGSGADRMFGGRGNDTYIVDNLGDQVIEGLNNGSDTVSSSATFKFSTGDNLEDLTLTGTNDIDGAGNELDNLITGNSGINRLEGKGGTDHLIGNGGNDILAGGTGDNDLLEGGAGFDTYLYNAGDGTDRIEDSDASGQIIFNGHRLLGGIHDPNDPLNTYKSLDGLTTYVLSGTDLIVNGVLTVNENFQSGQFGIQLDDLSNYPTNTGVPEGPFQDVYTGTADTNFWAGVTVTAGHNGAYYGLGGRDVIFGDIIGNNLLDGGEDDDFLRGDSGGNEYLDGGAGNDYLVAAVHFDLANPTFYDGIFDGTDILLGGAGDDVLIVVGALPVGVAPDPDYLDGGEGNDYLRGGVWAERLLGGDGDDTLRGDNLPDGWPQAVTPDGGIVPTIVPGQAVFSAIGGADFLDGGTGNDLLVGDGGNDILSGGDGNDQLFGDDEAGYLVVPGDDLLDGGAGDDLLAGGDGNDSLSGGTGIDQLFGDKGNDILDGGDEVDTLHGGDGRDELFGGAGADQLFGDGLNNPLTLSAAGGADFIDGGAGNDHLEGGIGDDTLFGGTENDVLFGDEGVDSLFGDEGDDELQGGEGNDLLGGDAGDDRLFGQADNDTLYGDEGNDQLAGNDGADTLVGGNGNDVLEGGHGNDGLIGGAGQDLYNFSLGDGADTITDRALAGEGNLIQFFGGITLGSLTFIQDQAQQTLTIQVAGGGSIQLLGFDPNTFNYVVDTLSFANGTQVALADQLPLPGGLIEGTDGSNVIRTGATDDTIFAGAGNDVVNAGAGHDVLVGGVGNDFLVGGAGQDTYVFNAGDGTDTISDTAGEDNRIVFGAGMASSSITLGKGAGNTLEIRGQLPGDRLEVGALVPGASPIDTFEFADGTVLTFDQFIARGINIAGTAGSDILFGTSFIDLISAGDGDDIMQAGDGNDVLNGEAGNDDLEGEAGDDVLVGGIGDDQLLGGAGNDTYRFNLGDGLDSISDSVDVGEPNRVLFGSGITSSSVTLTTNFGQIVVRPGAAFEGVMVGANGSDALGFHAVDNFEFADGIVLTYSELVARGFDIDGTEFDDVLFGTNVIDRFRGGLGNDRMEGGAENDSYFFNVGDGVDTIVDTASAGAGNEIVFGPGITSADLRLDLAPDQSDAELRDLLIRVGMNGDAVQLDTFDRDDVLGLHTVGTFRFADGSTLSYDQLLARGFDLTGTAADDQIEGTNVDDRIISGDGADVLQGGLGNDTLDGGTGDDRLIGGQGNDTYVFGPGFGQDAILEFEGSLDRISMAAGVAPSDVVVTRNNNDLVLSLNGGTDRLTVSLYFLALPLQIEQVLFADGTVWDHAFIENLTRPTINGTGGIDVLVGTAAADQLFGLAGNDQLTGLSGNDLLDGGTGADILTGGLGDDTYVIDAAGDVVIEALNEGIDTIQSSVTSTLAANVENLTLTGTSAINGTGNALDNVLTGNSAANVLTGGAGHDTYVVGAGDTIVELAGEGTDTVEAATSVTLGANLENLTLTGSASLTGTGNSLDNVLKADGSISVLAGGEGNDTYLIGPNGDDDILVETAAGGIDTVIAAHDYRLPDHVENLTLRDPRIPNFGSFSLVPYQLSDATIAGFGNDLNNTLIGGRANNLLDGGLGADTMVGVAGDDTYIVDNSSDMVVELANEGTDTVQASASYVLLGNVENLTLTGTGSVSGTGNALNNDIRGNDASNVLDGGTGDDSLQGFGGADTYLFDRGSGRDIVFDSGAAGEVDTIEFASTVAPGDVEVYRRDYNLVLLISGTSDQLTLASFFDSPGYDQKQVRFADGTVWSSAELSMRAVAGGVLIGSSGNDAIVGSGTDDVLIGNAGDDVLTGGRGNDALYGDATFQSQSGSQVIGNDTLRGGPGDDSLIDFRGTNLFDGGAGNDSLVLGTGFDTVLFDRGSGVDAVRLDNNGADIDIIQMAAGIAPADVVLTWRSASSADLLIADSGDRLTVTLSTDFFAVGPETTQAVVRFTNGTEWNLAWSGSNFSAPTATPFDDVITGLPGAVLRGLAGNDTYSVGAASGPVVELTGEGIDTVQSAVDYMLPANVENLILLGNFTSVGPYANNATGNELDNFIIGNTRDNILDGGAGNDVLVGGVFHELEGPPYIAGTGSDILIGGQGDDVLMADVGNFSFVGGLLFLNGGLDFQENVTRRADDLFIGGTGNDTYILHSQRETVAEFAGEGTDTVQSTVNYTLGDHVENLTLLENPVSFLPGPLLGTGNELDNVLLGNSEDNVLSGGIGNDTLWGGSGLYRDSEAIQSGNDLLIGGIGNDTYLFKLGDGLDTIQDNALAGEGNRIQFEAGIAQNDLTFTQDSAARTLTIQVGSSGMDKLVLTNFDPTGANGSLVVETLAFADGNTASLAALLGGPVNHTPMVANALADRTVSEDVPFTIVVPVNTFADQDVGDVLTYSASFATGAALPTWINFNAATRTFSGTPDDAQVGTLDLRVTVTDTGSLTVSDVFTLTVQNVNEAPTVAAPLANQQATEDAPFSLVVPANTFADQDLGDSLTYSATLANGIALPSWLSFNAATRTFSGTPLNGDVGGLSLAVTATDTSGLSATETFVLTVQNVNDAPTVAVPLTDQQATQGTAFSFVVAADTFADVDAGDVLAYSAALADGNPLPAWLSFNPVTRTLSGTPGSGDVGTIEVRVTATDTGTLSASDVFALTVDSNEQVLTGTVGNDVLTGGVGNDQLFGLAGNDSLNGGAGNDFLDGGAGTDTMTGGTGNDTYAVDAVGDVVTELANEGIDTIQSALLAYTLGANLENLTLIGTGPSAGIGNALNNVLIGNSGSNLLDGKAGADQMSGGAGDDVYNVDHVGDVVVELAGEGTLDTVSSSVTYTLSTNVEHLILTGTAAINGIGNALDNVLTGNSAANVLTGRAGNDTYLIGTGDIVVEAANEGADTVISILTHTLAANVENLTLLGFSSVSGTGNALDNVLNGLLNFGSNTLTGGGGNDTYILGSGDTVVEAANGGTDTVQSSGTHTLAANVDNLTLTGAGAINGTGNSLNNTMTGNSAANMLSSAGGNDTLRGNGGNDTVNGGGGNDTFLFGRGEGQDLVQDNSGTADKLLYDSGINPLDLVISRQANDLRLSIHGSTDAVTVQNWYVGATNRTETIQAGNGQMLLSAQVDQLIQAMASFSQQSGLTWDQAIDQQPQAVQTVLAASWQ